MASCLLLAGHAPFVRAQVPAGGASVGAQVKAAAVAYELPAMPLARALQAIARDFKVQIEVDEAKLSGMRSQPVVGLHDARSAAAAALEGSGLVLSQSAGGALAVGVRTTAAQAVTIIGAKRNQAETGFKADYSATTARNGVSLQETPAGVTVITSKVIESQQATSLIDVLNSVSSVVVSQGSQRGANPSVRGMSDVPLLSNGLAPAADTRGVPSSVPNVATVERVEVLKGPQAILAGSGVLTGGINIVTKKPQEDPVHRVSLQRGSRDDTTLSVDLSSAVMSDDKRLTYRLIATNTTESQSAAGFDGRRNSLVSPALRWKDAQTDVTLSLTQQRDRSAPNRWTSSVNGVIQPLLARLPGNRSDGASLDTNAVAMDLEQKLPYNLTLVSRLERKTMQDNLEVYLPLANMDPKTQTYGFMGSNVEGRYVTVTGDHYLRTKIDTGPIEHKLAVGVSHVKTTRDNNSYSAEGFLPVTLTDPSANFPVFGNKLIARDHSENTQSGVYLQNMMRWSSTSLLVNVRRSKYESADSVSEPAPGGGPKRITPGASYNATTSTAGVVHSITDSISVYGMVGKGFQPQSAENWCGPTAQSPKESGFKPMETTNKEIGAKFDLLNSKLAVTAGFFDLSQTGRPLYVPNQNCMIMTDGQQARGLDIDVQGELAKGLNVIANFTQTKLKDLVDPKRSFDGQPKQQGSVWLQYQLPWAQVRGLGVGLGVSVHGKSTAGAAFSPVPTVVPAWTRTDASLFYENGPWTTTLGIKNLSGKRIYGYSPSPIYMPIIYDGRDVRMTVGYRFD